MSLATFSARDTVSALMLVEQHLGEDALIHSVKMHGAFVSVIAAADPAEKPLRRPRSASRKPPPSKDATPAQMPQETEAAALERAAEGPERPPEATDPAPAPAVLPQTPPPPLILRNPIALAPPVSPVAHSVRPSFLDPTRPKPFGPPEPVQGTERMELRPPSGARARDAAPEGSGEAARRKAAAADYIVLATLGLQSPFGVAEAFLRLLPGASASAWEEGGAFPWDAASPATSPAGQELILCQARGAEFNRLVAAASAAPDVAFLVLLPAQADLASIASLGRMLGQSITGTILVNDAEEAAPDTVLTALRAAALSPLWQFQGGRLSPCGPEPAPRSVSAFFRRATALHDPPAAGVA